MHMRNANHFSLPGIVSSKLVERQLLKGFDVFAASKFKLSWFSTEMFLKVDMTINKI